MNPKFLEFHPFCNEPTKGVRRKEWRRRSQRRGEGGNYIERLH
jgi:hypothetical protein